MSRIGGESDWAHRATCLVLWAISREVGTRWASLDANWELQIEKMRTACLRAIVYIWLVYHICIHTAKLVVVIKHVGNSPQVAILEGVAS
jgi:hypothetical protein